MGLMVVVKVKMIMESSSTFQINANNVTWHCLLFSQPIIAPQFSKNRRYDRVKKLFKWVNVLFNPELYEFTFKSHNLKCFRKLICCSFCDNRYKNPRLYQYYIPIYSFQNMQTLEQFFEPLYWYCITLLMGSHKQRNSQHVLYQNQL